MALLFNRKLFICMNFKFNCKIFSNPVSDIDFFGYILPFEVLRSKSINPSDFIAYIFQSNYGRYQYNQIWIFLNAQNFTFF